MAVPDINILSSLLTTADLVDRLLIDGMPQHPKFPNSLFSPMNSITGTQSIRLCFLQSSISPDRALSELESVLCMRRSELRANLCRRRSKQSEANVYNVPVNTWTYKYVCPLGFRRTRPIISQTGTYLSENATEETHSRRLGGGAFLIYQ